MRKMTSKNLRNLQRIVAECPFSRTLDALGNRWRAIILWKLFKNVRRFGELRQAIPGITEKMLAQELRELETRGFVTRVVHSERPLHVEYHVTSLGWSLQVVLGTLFDWGEQNFEAVQLSNQLDASK